jgi:hypothetical protein
MRGDVSGLEAINWPEFDLNKPRRTAKNFAPLCASFVPRNFCQGFVISGG